ncbi:hypothetical protein GCM10009787_29720 [Streptomyces bangladeshensis]|uniref:Uncharacterized protein n=1 Tax=Streptomyces bangladeshensis TaxID=295352 RepID=A0ABP5N9N7_9ACTN
MGCSAYRRAPPSDTAEKHIRATYGSSGYRRRLWRRWSIARTGRAWPRAWLRLRRTDRVRPGRSAPVTDTGPPSPCNPRRPFGVSKVAVGVIPRFPLSSRRVDAHLS